MSSTRDAEAKNTRLFDLRTLERSIKKGIITRKDYEKYVKSLPDATENVAPIEEAEEPASSVPGSSGEA